MDDLIHLDLLEELENAEVGEENIREWFKKRVDSFKLSDTKFKKIYRLDKNVVRDLIVELSEFLPDANRRTTIDAQTKVLIALRFYASGSYQTGIGNDMHLAVSQKTVSNAIKEVTTALNNVMDRYITFPIDPEGQAAVMRGFSVKYGVSGLLGLIDCTHISIVPPNSVDPHYAEHNYVNRKGQHTINVQLICDSEMKILHINALHPGSTSDKFIWRYCNLRQHFVEEYRRNRQTKKFLFGDSGYNLEPWTLIPDLTAEEDTPEHRYNTLHCHIRSGIERCNGLFKQRFRCLIKDRVLHYHPEKATQIINACAVLHNLCVARDIEYEPGSDESDISDEEDQGFAELEDHGRIRRNPVLVAGERQRAEFIRRHFV